jgi:hypothetical protein
VPTFVQAGRGFLKYSAIHRCSRHRRSISASSLGLLKPSTRSSAATPWRKRASAQKAAGSRPPGPHARAPTWLMVRTKTPFAVVSIRCRRLRLQAGVRALLPCPALLQRNTSVQSAPAASCIFERPIRRLERTRRGLGLGVAASQVKSDSHSSVQASRTTSVQARRTSAFLLLALLESYECKCVVPV